MRYFMILCALLLIGSCVGGPSLTEEERAWEEMKARENWRMCELVYRQSNELTVHRDHTHNKGREIPMWMVRDDLFVNNCRVILGEYWYD